MIDFLLMFLEMLVLDGVFFFCSCLPKVQPDPQRPLRSRSGLGAPNVEAHTRASTLTLRVAHQRPCHVLLFLLLLLGCESFICIAWKETANASAVDSGRVTRRREVRQQN